MKRSFVLSAILLTACGSDEPDSSGQAPVITFECPGGTVVDGLNQLTVGDRERAFYADFPNDVTQPMGVLFSWHGFTDTPENHRDIAGLDPNANTSLPVVVITPDDTGIQPPLGLDWDIGQGMPGEANVDIAYFEAILGCLNEQHEIDSARIYSLGFSAGSVMTSLLHSRYPKLLSAIVNVSGAWFNDPAEVDLVNVFDVAWSWPALDPADGGAALLTHGGPTDVTVLNVLDLEASAQAALPFLKANNRVVVDCPHDNGHTLHPDVTSEVVGAFISAHRAGQPSPYRSGGYVAADFPVGCTLQTP